MIILGIDPGLATTGYGILSGSEAHMKPVAYGSILTPPDWSISCRLEAIYRQVTEIIDLYQPIEIGVEELFFSRNVSTALVVGQARGVILLAAQQKGLKIMEYKPMEVKLAVTGYGRAEKKQVQQMVKILLGLAEIPKPDDTADALAIAICHMQSRKMKALEQQALGRN
jgi:crossover junction endodeoxyribonuclease RuvC